MTITIGVDVGGTKILAAAVTEDGEILSPTRVPTPRTTPEDVVWAVGDLVQDLLSLHPAEAVGVGVAGLVDATRSIVLMAPNLGWRRQALASQVEMRCGLPTVVENDANAAAWGEFRFGAGVGLAELVAVTVGTGLGGGLILDGRLRRGVHGVAAEIGHMVVKPEGRPCPCGKSGCWEQYCSGTALVREARRLAAERPEDAAILLTLGDGTPVGISGAHITDAATRGDVVALAAFERIGTWLGAGLADLAALLDPRAFVIGGGVSEAGDLLLASARRAFASSSVSSTYVGATEIRVAELGNLAGVAGAADLARDRESIPAR